MVNIIYKEHDMYDGHIVAESEITVKSCFIGMDTFTNKPYLNTYVLGDKETPVFPMYIVPKVDYDQYTSIMNGILLPVYDVTIKVNGEPKDFLIETMVDMYEFKDILDMELILSDL